MGERPIKSLAITFLVLLSACQTTVEQSDMTDLTAFATRYAAAWSGQEPADLASFYAENGSLQVNDGEPSVGRDAVTETAHGFMTAFPDMVVRLVELRETDDYVEFHWHWTGTNTGPGGTGSAVDLRGYERWTLDAGGLILESLGHFDESEYQRQLHEPDSSSEHATEFKLVTREAWGWKDDATRLPEHHIEAITIHHGGEKFPDDRDPMQYLKALQAWSRSDKGWIDIPYHYVVDLKGKVYEARPVQFPGDTNTSYDPTGHVLIQVVGNYEDRKFSAAQLAAVIQLSAMLARQHEVSVSDIRGHRDYAPAETVCPGENIYQYLRDGTITARVADLLSADYRSERR